MFTTTEFRFSNWMQQLPFLGLSDKTLFSHFSEWDRKKVPVKNSIYYTRMKQQERIAEKHYLQAQSSLDHGMPNLALLHLSNALSVHAENIEALLLRGKINASFYNIRQAFLDTESALRLNPGHVPARKQMSGLLVDAAETHIEQGNEDKAQESLAMARDLDASNKKAALTVEAYKDLMHRLRVEYESGEVNNQETMNEVVNTEEYLAIQETYQHPIPVPASYLNFLRKKPKKHLRKRSRHHRHHKKSKPKSSPPAIFFPGRKSPIPPPPAYPWDSSQPRQVEQHFNPIPANKSICVQKTLPPSLTMIHQKTLNSTAPIPQKKLSNKSVSLLNRKAQVSVHPTIPRKAPQFIPLINSPLENVPSPLHFARNSSPRQAVSELPHLGPHQDGILTKDLHKSVPKDSEISRSFPDIHGSLHESRSPPEGSLRSRSPPHSLSRNNLPSRNHRKSKSPSLNQRRSRSPPQSSLKSRSPPRSSLKSRSPPQSSLKSRSPPRSYQKSRSPPRSFCRNRSPVRKSHYLPQNSRKSKSPDSGYRKSGIIEEREHHRSISPSPEPYRSRSPSVEYYRDRSLSPCRLKSQSLSPDIRRSRSLSPNLHRSRSRSPNIRKSTSQSPNLHDSKSSSPYFNMSRSPSPIILRSNSSSPIVIHSSSPSPHQVLHRSRSPPQGLHRRSRSPPNIHRNDSPHQVLHRSRSPPLNLHLRSRSPPRNFHRNRTVPGARRSRSPSRVYCKSRSPPRIYHRNRSPPRVLHRSRSPPRVLHKSRSPPRYRHKSRSPRRVRHRSRSPRRVRHRSRSPSQSLRQRCRSPTQSHHKSKSPSPQNFQKHKKLPHLKKSCDFSEISPISVLSQRPPSSGHSEESLGHGSERLTVSSVSERNSEAHLKRKALIKSVLEKKSQRDAPTQNFGKAPSQSLQEKSSSHCTSEWSPSQDFSNFPSHQSQHEIYPNNIGQFIKWPRFNTSNSKKISEKSPGQDFSQVSAKHGLGGVYLSSAFGQPSLRKLPENGSSMQSQDGISNDIGHLGYSRASNSRRLSERSPSLDFSEVTVEQGHHRMPSTDIERILRCHKLAHSNSRKLPEKLSNPDCSLVKSEKGLDRKSPSSDFHKRNSVMLAEESLIQDFSEVSEQGQHRRYRDIEPPTGWSIPTISNLSSRRFPTYNTTLLSEQIPTIQGRRNPKKKYINENVF